jgi:Fe-S-cluster-containing hydrogenase component 2
MVKRIWVREALCTGCRACEVVCVAQHDGRFGTRTARLRVRKIEPSGIDRPEVCRACGRAPCVSACPAGALSKDERSAVAFRADRCLPGCSACYDACPFGMVTRDPATGLLLICDLCDGSPACVKRCATRALVYATRSSPASRKRERTGGAEEPPRRGIDA